MSVRFPEEMTSKIIRQTDFPTRRSLSKRYQEEAEKELSGRISRVPSYIHPTIIKNIKPSTQRLISKDILRTINEEEYYDEILASVTINDLNFFNDIKDISSWDFIIYESWSDDYKLQEDGFRATQYMINFKDNSLYQTNKFEIRVGLDGSYKQEYDDSHNLNVNFDNLLPDYYFDIQTLNYILIKRNIPFNVREDLLRREYNKRLNNLIDIEVAYYIYAKNFDFENFKDKKEEYIELYEPDIPDTTDPGFDIEEFIPDYEEKIFIAKERMADWIYNIL